MRQSSDRIRVRGHCVARDKNSAAAIRRLRRLLLLPADLSVATPLLAEELGRRVSATPKHWSTSAR